MKKLTVALLLLSLVLLPLLGCGLTNDPAVKEYREELPAATGCWRMDGDPDTYFTLDGSKGAMTFSYVEDGAQKYNGTFRVMYRGLGKDVLTPLSLLLQRSDKEKEDWLSCYAEAFETDFTQFTLMKEEEDLGVIDGTVYTHIYRISELPYKMGTYVLEGKPLRAEGKDYSAANALHIPCGTYALETGECFTFLMTKPTHQELFRYQNGDTVIEGTLWIAQDRKTVYLYIEHDPYSKVTKADRAHYDTTFDLNYPPDFYLRGDFSDPARIVIDGLYHHEESPTAIEDAVWVFGTYTKQMTE